MSSSLPLFHAPSSSPRLRERRCLGAARANSRLPEILAFWALWHCRHARPPDALLVR
ncbi:MAG TPA: hypothetical protein VJ047_01200 [Pseudomonas sp.]|nr:hypothetical protein [Pseudomonas sp.]